jgi:hypothetical protein
VDPTGVVHVLWYDSSEGCAGCFRVAYDQFKSIKPTGTYRAISDDQENPGPAQLLRTPDGTLIASWTTPARDLLGAGVEITLSENDGETWLDEPLHVAVAEGDMQQPFLFQDLLGNLILVFNLENKDEVFYQVSQDLGETWSAYAPVPGLLAGRPVSGNDRFAATADSTGVMHLLAVGRRAKDQIIVGLYHVSWNGENWTAPTTVYQEDQFIELPALAIGNGNRLYATFSTRSRIDVAAGPDPSSQVWFSTALTQAPAQTRVPLPTATASPTPEPTATEIVEPTRRPTATREPFLEQPESPTAQQADPQFPLIAAIVPVAALLALVLVVNMILRRRR